MSGDEHEANREAARQIELQRPGWMVVWGVYSKQYVAFPLFAAPAGTIVAAAYPPALESRMQAVELRAQARGAAA
jgi:hypothetical protein